jgi:hypothetical protein
MKTLLPATLAAALAVTNAADFTILPDSPKQTIKGIGFEIQSDSTVDVTETKYDANARIFAFRKPDGKLTIVVSNRSQKERAFAIATGHGQGAWQGWRYTPEEAGAGTMGVPIGTRNGPAIKLMLPAQSWEFWEQQ